MDTKKLDELVRKRITLKRQEDEFAEQRKEVDQAIAYVISEGSERKGTISTKLVDAGVKLAVSFGTTRKVDPEYVEANFPIIPMAIKACLRQKWEVTSAFDKLTPELKLEAAKFIETKDASPSIKIEVI